MLTIIVIAHLIVNLLHGRAHTELGVGLTSWQQLYVIAVILLAPLIGLVLLWTRYNRTGLWLLFASMLGSLIFGACYHYIIVSNDHVAHLPPGDARGMFRVTALLLLITEAVGVVLAAMALKTKNFTSRQTYSRFWPPDNRSDRQFSRKDKKSNHQDISSVF